MDEIWDLIESVLRGFLPTLGFLVQKDIGSAVSRSLISFRLGAAPFNITIKQVYEPTSSHDDIEVDHLYQQLKETIDKTPKKNILVVQGNCNL